MKIRSFRDLDVWKCGTGLVMDVYQTTREFPREEIFGLTSQMRRAAVSVPANIAEGFNRHHSRDYRRFLLMALGSCGELETELEIARQLEYLDENEANQMLESVDHEARMLRNLIKSLRC